MDDLKFEKMMKLEAELYVTKLEMALRLARNALSNARDGAANGSPFSTHSFDLCLQIIDAATPVSR